MASGLSKYATKLALRRREDGGAANPMPRPFSWDYHPKHEVIIYQGKEDEKKWLPHEFKNKKQIEFFRVPYKLV